MKVLGLTGGVGMGKSTAAGFFSSQGIRAMDTDDIARQLVQPGQPALEEIKNKFGDEILSNSGELKRADLARIIFADPVARQRLEAILHPLIREQWLGRLKIWRQENCPLAVVVIPLLFETSAENYFDQIICAACSPATQHRRLINRGWDEEQILQRLAAQWPVDQKIARAHFVIWTEGAKESQSRQIDKIIGLL